MTTFRRRRGDINDPIVARLQGVSTLEGVVSSVWAVVTHEYSNEQVTLTAVVSDALNNEVTISTDPWLETADLGAWSLDTKIQFANGAVWSWPRAFPPDTIEVT